MEESTFSMNSDNQAQFMHPATSMQFEPLRQQPAKIKVIGVGGGGGNAVNHMFRQGIHGVDFIVCNTDAKALAASPVPNKIELGKLGASIKTDGKCIITQPLKNITPTLLDSHNDHRIAMMLAILGLSSDGIRIEGCECVEKSYPDFFEVIQKISCTN